MKSKKNTINYDKEKAIYYESLISKLNDKSLKEKILNVLPNVQKVLFDKEESLKEFINAKPEDMWQYHFGLGIYLRDNYLKPDSEIYIQFIENGVKHIDDMSSVMVILFQRELLQNERQ